MKKFVSILLVIAFILAFNNAAFGCNCGCIEEAPETTVEEAVVEEEVITEEETIAEEAVVEEEVITEEETVAEEATEECEAFEAETFDHSANYGDYVAFDYVEEVVEEEAPVVEETPVVEEITVVEEAPVVEETTVVEEAPVTEEETPVVEQVQQVAAVAMEAVEETVEAAKPVIEKAQTAYVQTGCDKLVNTFMMQLCVMLAAIVALSVLLKHAVKQDK